MTTNKEATHTPGPWFATTDLATVRLHPWCVRAGDHVVTDIYEEADAHLIAAAPDLLAALEKVASHLLLLLTGNSLPNTYPSDFNEAQRAIAKARGEVAS